MSGTKRCCTCREEKPVERFSRYSYVRDGLQPSCKDCARLAVQRHRQRRASLARQRAEQRKGEGQDVTGA